MKNANIFGLAAAATLGMTLVAASPAIADTTCDDPTVTAPHLDGAEIAWSGSGRCTGRFLQTATLYRHYPWMPDLPVAIKWVQGSGESWVTASGKQCDSRGSTAYYAESATYAPSETGLIVKRKTSPKVMLSHC